MTHCNLGITHRYVYRELIAIHLVFVGKLQIDRFQSVSEHFDLLGLKSVGIILWAP